MDGYPESERAHCAPHRDLPHSLVCKRRHRALAELTPCVNLGEMLPPARAVHCTALCAWTIVGVLRSSDPPSLCSCHLEITFWALRSRSPSASGTIVGSIICRRVYIYVCVQRTAELVGRRTRAALPDTGIYIYACALSSGAGSKLVREKKSKVS